MASDVQIPSLISRTRSRVLLVEDDMTNVLVATGALELYGCQVGTVSNGEQALDACRRWLRCRTTVM
jgi:CheY-like chemotaxis protein